MNFLCKLIVWGFLSCLLATRVQAHGSAPLPAALTHDDQVLEAVMFHRWLGGGI
jgi:hypothetical protein